MKLFFGWITVAANDLEAAAQWYAEKFELKNSGFTEEDGSRFCALRPRGDEMEPEIVLCQKESGEAEPDKPILNTSNAAKAREWLLARDVNVGPVETDRQGTHYFEMRDGEGNTVEICEEP
jgi:predicted enzyme related to lactoylglutathione lyase